jgi:hypothetical protein
VPSVLFGVGYPASVKTCEFETGQYPLPQPSNDPVTLLTGHCHLEQSGSEAGSCAVNTDFDDTYTRIGN